MSTIQIPPAPYAKSRTTGFCVIDVLQFLHGRPWDDVAMGFVQALRPDKVRISQDGETKTDFLVGRITVYVDNQALIQNIRWEVEVGLPYGVKDGRDLMLRAGLIKGAA